MLAFQCYLNGRDIFVVRGPFFRMRHLELRQNTFLSTFMLS